MCFRPLTVAVVLGLTPIALAADEPPTREELLEQIQALQRRVEQLEAIRPSAADAEHSARVIDEMIEDATRRSKLLFSDGGVNAGFDPTRNKFYLGSTDGDFLLMPGVLFQTRNTTNYNSDGSDLDNGFEIRRLRPNFTGHLFTPDLRYFFQWETNSSGGGVFLLDAWVRYKFAERYSVQFGQFKDPVHHEQIMADEYLLAADRSLINQLIGGGQTDRVQGVALIYDHEKWRAQAAFHDGYNSKNTSYEQGGGTNLGGVVPTWGVSGRVEHFFMGTRGAYDQFTSRVVKEDLLVLGAGADFSQGTGGDVLFHTVDLQYNNAAGLGLYGAALGLWQDLSDGSNLPPGSFYNWGLLAQASQMLWKNKLEGFVRYDFTSFDSDVIPAGADDLVQEFLIGINYYFRGQNAKFTLDFGWLPEGSPISIPAIGVQSGNDDQFILRAQFQLFI